MEICKSDIESIVLLLEKGIEYVEQYAIKPCEQDKARQMRIVVKKLKRKLQQT